jgi:transportin-1
MRGYIIRYFPRQVRRPLFALLSDVTKRFWPLLQAHAGPLVPLLVEHLDPFARRQRLAVSINAAWALGELAVQAGPAMEPFAAPILARITPLFAVERAAGARSGSLLENAATTLGRLGGCCPAAVAANLGDALPGWCAALRNIRDGAEKEQAFVGLVAVLQAAPEAAAPALGAVCEAFSSWNRDHIAERPELHRRAAETLQAFRQLCGVDWPGLWDCLPPKVQAKLGGLYGTER